MQFPESWLRALVNPPLSTAELCHLLTMAGLEVEETQPVAPEFSNIVVARVLSVDKHPDASSARKLQGCTRKRRLRFVWRLLFLIRHTRIRSIG